MEYFRNCMKIRKTGTVSVGRLAENKVKARGPK
jgi:hypothetical protein